MNGFCGKVVTHYATGGCVNSERVTLMNSHLTDDSIQEPWDLRPGKLNTGKLVIYFVTTKSPCSVPDRWRELSRRAAQTFAYSFTRLLVHSLTRSLACRFRFVSKKTTLCLLVHLQFWIVYDVICYQFNRETVCDLLNFHLQLYLSISVFYPSIHPPSIYLSVCTSVLLVCQFARLLV